jgi:hypothetical protein
MALSPKVSVPHAGKARVHGASAFREWDKRLFALQGRLKPASGDKKAEPAE